VLAGIRCDLADLRLDIAMAPKHHPTRLSGSHRKALTKELGKARAMTGILAAQSSEMRAKRMWSDGEPIDPSPTIDQAINGGFPWLEIPCSRCKTPNDVDLAALKHPPTTFVHDLASRLRCRKCAKTGRRPSATLLQLSWQPRHPRAEV
jgi:phage FluMu protein Com